jgi:PAS domain S-box-containing protein
MLYPSNAMSYELLRESIRDGFVSVAMDGRILDFNEVFRRLLGYERDELLSKTERELTPASWLPIEKKIYEEQLRQSGRSSLYEKEYQRKDGILVRVEVYSVLLTENGGAPKGVWIFVRDLAENVSEGSFEAIFNDAPFSLVVYSAEGRVLRVNDAFVRLWGARITDVNPDYNVLTDQQTINSGLIDLVKKAFDGEVVEFPLRQYKGEEASAIGLTKWVRAAMYPIKDSRRKVHNVVGLHEDVSEKVMMEKQLRAAKDAAESVSRIKSEFLDVAAHELRTPLTPLTLFVQKMKLQTTAGQSIPASFVERMEQQIYRLTGLVDDLLNVSRLERGGLVVRPEKVDLMSLVRECAGDFKTSAPSFDLAVIGPENPLYLSLDPVRITQVLWNLLDNALKYSPGDKFARLTVVEKERTVRVSVIDKGSGIAKEKQVELFSRFYRVNANSTYGHAGMGLGLYICRQIVERHGGTIGVDSDVGKGSVFYFDLPKEEKPVST